VYHRKIKRKVENTTWIGPGEKPKPTGRFEAKTLFSIFFRASGKEGIDAEYYMDNCLQPVINEIKIQRPDTGTKGIARAHIALEVKLFKA